jgi:hypothetical protein
MGVTSLQLSLALTTSTKTLLIAHHVKYSFSMTEHLDRLTKHVCSKLRVLGFSSPSPVVMREILNTAYLASLKTEEGQFIRGSLTYCDPNVPEINPPILRRADYPAFTPFGHRTPLTVDAFVKLSRAIDGWSGSITVYGTKKTSMFIWGVVDQLVHHNVRLNREANKGFSIPGIVSVCIDGVGDISVCHGDLFLGRLKQNRLIKQEVDALRSQMVANRVVPKLATLTQCIALALESESKECDLSDQLFNAWTNTVARICIGLRRLGTGGSLLITSTPIIDHLDIVHRFGYRRLGDSTILSVLDRAYRFKLEQQVYTQHSGSVPTELSRELLLAETDSTDREDELTGAVKIVTSLAAADGLVLLDLSLAVVGFGVKIRTEEKVNTVYDGSDFVRKGTKAKKIDPSRFGTRHGSMLRYCRADCGAIGVVVSQDGHVRLITSEGKSLILWDNVKLLSHDFNVSLYARDAHRRQRYRDKHRNRTSLGYTSMPKTIRALFAYGKKNSPKTRKK